MPFFGFQRCPHTCEHAQMHTYTYTTTIKCLKKKNVVQHHRNTGVDTRLLFRSPCFTCIHTYSHFHPGAALSFDKRISTLLCPQSSQTLTGSWSPLPSTQRLSWFDCWTCRELPSLTVQLMITSKNVSPTKLDTGGKGSVHPARLADPAAL